MTHQKPLVPRVAVIGRRTKPYQLPSLAAYEVAYSTPAFVNVHHGVRTERHSVGSVICIPTETHWQQLLRHHEALAESLDELAQRLKACGRYSDVLATNAFDNQPRRLCQTVIEAPYPEEEWIELNPKPLVWSIPMVVRVPIERHTPKKLVYQSGERKPQMGHYCCAGDVEWQTILDWSNLCDRLRNTLNTALADLGTYEQERTALKWQDQPLSLFGQ